MATSNTSNVQVIRVGHALVLGPRGEAGGAPSKNSIWGVATVGAALVTFSGRVGGTLRFKARHASMKDAMVALFADKCAGKGMDYHYKDVTANHNKVYEGLDARIASDYKAAKTQGLINMRDSAVKAADSDSKQKVAKAPKAAAVKTAPKAKATKAAAVKTAPKAKAQPKASKAKAEVSAPKVEAPVATTAGDPSVPAQESTHAAE